MSSYCGKCGHGAEYGLQARDCAEPQCGCGERAREAERLAHGNSSND
jgi:hypothetical protein